MNENEQYQLEDQAPAEDQGEQSSEESDIGIANEKENGELQEDYDIINIQKTQNQFYQVQQLTNDNQLQMRVSEDDNIVADVHHEDPSQINQSKNNKTQPLPKQLIRVAKDQPTTADYEEALGTRKPSAGAAIPESTQARKKANSRGQKSATNNLGGTQNKERGTFPSGESTEGQKEAGSRKSKITRNTSGG